MKKINLLIAILITVLLSSCGRILMVWDITEIVKLFFGLLLMIVLFVWIRGYWNHLKEWFKK